ncbi:MAG: hypothetical protein ACXWT1_04550 [Methylobacter sp.]
MPGENIDQQKAENIRTVYRELCSSYRAIDDFRTKLLGFLPLATGGIFLLIANPEKFTVIYPLLMPIGVFGFAIALGLFFFELYGIRKCTCLIVAGEALEKEMVDIKGQFTTRPPGILGFINEPFAAGIIYPAVLAAWAYLALRHPAREIACFAAIWVFTVGLLISCLFIFWLKYHDKPA